jgi:hypothetical protein
VDLYIQSHIHLLGSVERIYTSILLTEPPVSAVDVNIDRNAAYMWKSL